MNLSNMTSHFVLLAQQLNIITTRASNHCLSTFVVSRYSQSRWNSTERELLAGTASVIIHSIHKNVHSSLVGKQLKFMHGDFWSYLRWLTSCLRRSLESQIVSWRFASIFCRWASVTFLSMGVVPFEASVGASIFWDNASRLSTGSN